MALSSLDSATLEERLAACEGMLGYPFRDRELLERCLTHASIARTRLESNERLEFLGDAILGALTCELLYERFPEEPEGELTRIKSVVVSRTSCARISSELGLDRCLILGKGLSLVDQVPSSVVAAVFESIVAGIYLDGGWDAARGVLRKLLEQEIDRVLQTTHGKNYKSLLQQIAQKSLGSTPLYLLLDEKGPDHSKCFKVAATVSGQTYPGAWGPNKKEAEQRAAENAWCTLQGLPVPYATDTDDAA
jgi:ribonuclease-3